VTTITLLPHSERLALPGAVPGYAGRGALLDHQARTYQALATGAPLVVNSYPTGSGKTMAALLRLLHPDQRDGNTLIIAPTNALLDQQAADARQFVADHRLPLDVVPFNADLLRQLAPELRRPGEKIQRMLDNQLTFWEGLGLPADAERRPFVAVTNPDIFYYALYFQYHPHDQRNIFTRFISRFSYVVIDEFHYYDAKQFANFLFFFTLWRRWGYFDHGRAICLLSATPRDNVRRYLDRVFEGGRWAEIGPDDEPPESAGLPVVPALSELRLRVVPGDIESWAEDNHDEVRAWLAAGLDTVMISSSLLRVNRLARLFRDHSPTRITGPEPWAERQRVSGLTLATPTVDIGYNFGRPGKRRQSIDRLVCDARFSDELTQRIGRAGRVLGRAETDLPSEAVVVLPEAAVEQLKAYDGRRLSRREWAALIAAQTALRPKHELEGYISSQAITESFYPIYRIQQAASLDAPLDEELFAAVKAVFAPQTRRRPRGLSAFFRCYERRRAWLRKPEERRWALQGKEGDELAQHAADYFGWLKSRRGVVERYRPEEVRGYLPQIVRDPEQRADVTEFIAAQVAVTGALFSFREAWQGPPAAIFDRERIFSSQPISRYDILHLFEGYTLRMLPDRAAFQRLHGSVDEASVYAELDGLRAERLSLGLSYESRWPEEAFRRRCCRAVTALRGLRLSARNRDGGPVTVDGRVRACIEGDYVPCLVVHHESWHALFAVVRGTPFYPRLLTVLFPEGTTADYQIITGVAAFHILPELNRHFLMLDRRLDDDAIWC
jgi:CRISPR-associated endonuclease/helicase Cas3